MQTPEQKYNKLIKILKDLNGVVVAFSGGVDSALLLHASVKALGDRVLAVTISGDIHASDAADEALRLAAFLGARHKIIKMDFLKNNDFCSNSTDRCYICKKEMFSRMLEVADEEGLPALVEGSNVSDSNDYRPGKQAAVELGVYSPLQQAGLAKGEIRLLARKFKIPVWGKPSDTCLCTRIPYGEHIDAGKIARIKAAEKFLLKMGFSSVRVRSFNLMASIEVEKKQVTRLSNEMLADTILSHFKKLGFKQVCINLEGYRSGGLNKFINHGVLGRQDY